MESGFDNISWTPFKSFLDAGMLSLQELKIMDTANPEVLKTYRLRILNKGYAFETYIHAEGMATEFSDYEGNFQSYANKSPLPAYKSGRVSVTTAGVEAKVNAAALVDRTHLSIYNDTSKTIYFGPPGLAITAMQELKKTRTAYLPNSETNTVTLKVKDGSAVSVLVQEWSNE